MEISVVILSEEEVRQAVEAWLRAQLLQPVKAGRVQPVKHKRQAQVYAVAVTYESGDPLPEEG